MLNTISMSKQFVLDIKMRNTHVNLSTMSLRCVTKRFKRFKKTKKENKITKESMRFVGRFYIDLLA